MDAAETLPDNHSTALDDLEARNHRLQEELDDCKSLILELNREDNRFTDRDAQRKFRDLDNAVEDWLNDFFDRDGKYREWDTISQEQYDFVGVPTRLFPLEPEALSISGAVSWLSKRRCCGRFMISAVIWRYLQYFIFAEDLPLGTRDLLRGSSFIDDIHDVLVGIDNTSDRYPRARKWRSETLTAMIKTSRFYDSQKRVVERTAEGLEEEMHSWVRAPKPGNLSGFCQKCVKIAVELQTELRCCLSLYDFKVPALHEQTRDGMAKEWQLKSIDTWRSPTSDADAKPVMAIIPGLYRKITSEEHAKPVEVVKPLMIVAQGNAQRTRRASQSPSVSRTSKTSSRSKDMPEEATKGRSSSSWISRTLGLSKSGTQRPGAAGTSSEERETKRRARQDDTSKSGRRTPKESYIEDSSRLAASFSEQGSDEVITIEPSSFEHGPPISRRYEDLLHQSRRSQTLPVERRDLRDLPDRANSSPVSREHSQHHSGIDASMLSTARNLLDVREQIYEGVKLSPVPRDVGMSSSDMAPN